MTVRIRTAVRADLTALVAMLADDPLGAERETPSDGDTILPAYQKAFEAIDTDPNHCLLVAERDGRTIGMLQLSYLPHLTHRGAWRAQIEGVRVAADHRGVGVGRELVRAARERAAAHGCRILQLTTDHRRPEALRFYESLGFTATHLGLKYALESAS